MDTMQWVTAHAGAIWASVKDVHDSTPVQIFQWLLAAAAVPYVWRVLWPTWRILALSLYNKDVPWPWMRSLVDLWNLGVLTSLSREKWYRSARVRVEWEILRPRPQSPPLHHALPRHKGSFRETTGEARKRYRQELQDFSDSLRQWQAKLGEHLARSSASDGDVVIDVEDVSQIYARADGIRNYFGVLASDRSAQRFGADHFVSKVRVKRGFVAPLHLVAGLLAECEEQWGPVIEDYGRQIAQPLPRVRLPSGQSVPFADREHELRLQRLQTFLFDCWLLWGPSVPLCTCEAWHGGRPILQFGFGDENNSLAMLIKQPLSNEELRRFFASERVIGSALAVKVTGVTGVLQWGPSVASSEVSLAQQNVCAADEDRLALLVDELPLIAAGDADEGAARYYSAYLWLMFVICGEDGAPLYQHHPWRGVLPFFEHGNIAEEQALETIKRQLVVKTLSTVLRLLSDLPRLQLRFVCAIDEAGCGCKLLCPPPVGNSVRELMQEIIEANEVFAELRKSGLLRRRLHLDDALWLEGEYSSCNLPNLLDRYYGYIGSAEEIRSDEDDRAGTAPAGNAPAKQVERATELAA